MKKDASIQKRNKKFGGGRSRQYILAQRKKALLGIMDILILRWIKENPMSGQDIMNKIWNQFGIKISPGTMYPILFSLKRRHLVNIKIYMKRKLYFLTDKGKAVSKALTKDYLNIQKDILQFFKR